MPLATFKIAVPATLVASKAGKTALTIGIALSGRPTARVIILVILKPTAHLSTEAERVIGEAFIFVHWCP